MCMFTIFPIFWIGVWGPNSEHSSNKQQAACHTFQWFFFFYMSNGIDHCQLFSIYILRIQLPIATNFIVYVFCLRVDTGLHPCAQKFRHLSRNWCFRTCKLFSCIIDIEIRKILLPAGLCLWKGINEWDFYVSLYWQKWR